MKKEHTRSVDINQKACGDIDKERIEGSLIETIIFLLDSGKTKEEIVRLLFEEDKTLLRKLILC